MKMVKNFIGGRFVPARGEGWIDDLEPATGEVIARVADSDARDVDDAVEAARAAFPAWSGMAVEERSKMLLDLAGLVESHFDELVDLESEDSGKPVSLARSLDIPRAILNLRFFATAVLHASTEAHVNDGRAINYTLRRPVGVAGLISPWNLPLYLLTWKIAPAIATGNTVVAKPSELTPLTANRLAELVVESSMPAGVVNIVHGIGARVGEPIVGHPDVPLVSFTGGTATGARVASVAAPMFKKLSLELGGKNPTVVFADANLDEAVAGSVRAAFANQGEICLCGSRIFVERSIHDAFVERFVEEARKLRVGDPADPETTVGALISKAHRAKVESYVELARKEGGEVRCGGVRPSNLPERVRGGFFLEPAVVSGLGIDCRVLQDEIFGPVVTITPFDGEAEAVAFANATRYGLSSSVWTTNLDRAHRVAAAIDSGTVWINTWLMRDLRVPFGGMKQSGVGREGGRDSLEFFTEAKNVCIKLGDD